MTNKGRPATGQPSKKNDYRNAYEKRWRLFKTTNTASFEKFSEVVKALMPVMPVAHVKKLYTERCRQRRRYVTDVREIDALLRTLRPLSGTCEDVACGTRSIEHALRTHSPELAVRSWDSDGTITPDRVCDFTNPSEYKDVERPDWIITR
jgi:hypothetical protein